MELSELKECLHLEVVGKNRTFTWRKAILRAIKHRRVRFIFWWRIAKYCHAKGGYWRRIAGKIERKRLDRFDVKIPLSVEIGKGLNIAYLTGIVIGHRVTIGENCAIKPGVTIGLRGHFDQMDIQIGNNVSIGCNASILGGKVRIGNDVTIGAHALVMCDVPDNSVFITRVESEIISKQ